MEKNSGRKEFIIMTLAKDFIKDFDNLYKNDRTSIFILFQEGGFNLDEQKEIFDGLKTKQKFQLYNTISLDARNSYCDYINTLLTGKIAESGEPVTELDEFMKKLRGQAPKDALVIERGLLDQGVCTRDWKLEQIKEIYKHGASGKLSINADTPHEFNPFDDFEYSVSIDKK